MTPDRRDAGLRPAWWTLILLTTIVLLVYVLMSLFAGTFRSYVPVILTSDRAGLVMETGGKVTDKWSLFGGLVLMQSEVTRSLVPSPQPLLYASNVGLPLANVAHQSFSLLSKYQLTDMWELGGQAVFRSKVYGGTLLAANEGTSIPSYWRFDAFAEAKIDKNWRLKLYVNNIFNKLYYDALYQSATPFTLEAPGRAAYLVLSARY